MVLHEYLLTEFDYSYVRTSTQTGVERQPFPLWKVAGCTKGSCLRSPRSCSQVRTVYYYYYYYYYYYRKCAQARPMPR